MSVSTLPSKDQWIRKHKDYVIGPPKSQRPRGRPKKKRIKGADEASSSGQRKRVHKCTRCGGLGHHKNACKEPLRGNPPPASASPNPPPASASPNHPPASAPQPTSASAAPNPPPAVAPSITKKIIVLPNTTARRDGKQPAAVSTPIGKKSSVRRGGGAVGRGRGSFRRTGVRGESNELFEHEGGSVSDRGKLKKRGRGGKSKNHGGRNKEPVTSSSMEQILQRMEHETNSQQQQGVAWSMDNIAWCMASDNVPSAEQQQHHVELGTQASAI